MQTHPLSFGRHTAQSHSHAIQAGGGFAQAHPQTSGDAKHDALVKQTQKWVAQTFYGEMLKQMRNSPFRSKMFEGGDGGKAFSQMFDAKLADNMASGSGHKLVDSIVDKIEKGKNRSSNVAASKLEANKAYGQVTTTKPAAAQTVRSIDQLRIASAQKRNRAHPANFPRIKPAVMSPTLKAKIGGVR